MTTGRSSPGLQHRAGELRHDPTEAESKLWSRLRAHRFGDYHFRRQYAIGPFIVDFCSPRHKLVVEVDGGQHLNQEAYDAERTSMLESMGYKVLRFWNDEVLKDIDIVVKIILEQLENQG